MDREIQRIQLSALQNAYPHYLDIKMFQEALAPDAAEAFYSSSYHDNFMACLSYLQEHELVEMKSIDEPPDYDGYIYSMTIYKITAKGLDFLADDGGLSAILNTVTVKFDVDSTREILATGLMTAGVPDEKKGLLRSAIEGATADTIKELMKAVLRNPTGALESARTMLNAAF